MSNQSSSSNEGWSDIARELLELPGWEIEKWELSDTPGWEKITYTNGIVYEQPIPPKQLELFNFRQAQSDVNPSLTEFVSDNPVKIKPELLTSEPPKPPPGNVNEYFPGGRDTAYYRFSYRVGTRIKHKHIRGGNCCSKKAQAHAQTIRNMIARGSCLEEILKTIATF